MPRVNDGAGALVLMSEERAQKEGKTPFAAILLVMQKWQLKRRISRKHLGLSLMKS